jgi:hypothetical protein
MSAQTPQTEDLPGMLAVAKAVAEQKFPHTMDAQVWAEEFYKHEISKGLHRTDPGEMLGWFANAIMAGYDTARSRDADELSRLKALCEELREALERIEAETAATWIQDIARAALKKDEKP